MLVLDMRITSAAVLWVQHNHAFPHPLLHSGNACVTSYACLLVSCVLRAKARVCACVKQLQLVIH